MLDCSLCSLWAVVEGKVEMAEQRRWGKAKARGDVWGEATTARVSPGESLTLGRAMSGCEMSSGDLPGMAAHPTCLVFSKGGLESMGDPSDVASSPTGLV